MRYGLILLMLLALCGSGGLAAEKPRVVRLPLDKGLRTDQRMQVQRSTTAGAMPVLIWHGAADEKPAIRWHWPKGLGLSDVDELRMDVTSQGGRCGVIVDVSHPDRAKGIPFQFFAVDRPPMLGETICFDLDQPEQYDPRLAPAEQAGITITLAPRWTATPHESWMRTFKLSNVRLVRKVIELDWDQVSCSQTYTRQGDLVATFKLTVRSLAGTQKNVEIALQGRLELARAQALPARFPTLDQRPQPVTVTLTIPQARRLDLPLLYAERCRVWAAVAGVPDSDDTVLRSSDAIPLTIAVPLPPMARRQYLDLPRAGLRSGEVADRALCERILAGEAGLIPPAEQKQKHRDSGWLQSWWQIHLRNGRLLLALIHNHRRTDEPVWAKAAVHLMQEYAHTATQYPRRFFGTWEPTISATHIGHTTLESSWFLNAFLPAFDYCRARKLFSVEQERLITRQMLLPMALLMRNHNVGLNNMQIEVNTRIFYFGVLTRNWPLAAYAHSGLCGYQDQVAANFSADGWACEGHYYGACLAPLVQQAELMHRLGMQSFNDRLRRIFDGGVAKWPYPHCTIPMEAFRLAAERYDEALYATFTDPAVAKDLPSANMQYHGFSVLRQNHGGELAAAGMNWGCQEMRDAPDRMSVHLPFLDEIKYNHHSFDQATILVDGKDQKPRRGTIDFFGAYGRAAMMSASNDKLYEGVTIYRTVALIDGVYVVVDRLAGDADHRYDWTDMVRGVTGLPMQVRKTPFGNGYGYQKLDTHALLNGGWQTEWRVSPPRWLGAARGAKRRVRAHVLATPRTEIAAGGRVVVVRRTGKVVDSAVLYDYGSPAAARRIADAKWLETSAPGRAVAVQFALDGRRVELLVNYGTAPVSAGSLQARERCAVSIAGVRPH